jgi:D,D-heptose 1,7-bisphosphate phosphatase
MRRPEVSVRNRARSCSSVIPSMLKNSPLRGVIFDRDGVLIDDMHFTVRPNEIRWTPGAIELIRKLNVLGVRTMMATNQSGVARGYFTELQVRQFHEVMQQQLRAHGARIDAIEYCPHHPSEGRGVYLRDCDCRKPKAGMLKKLMREQGVAEAATLMIGDREVDMGAARAAGIEGMLFNGGSLIDAFASAGYNGRLPTLEVKLLGSEAPL